MANAHSHHYQYANNKVFSHLRSEEYADQVDSQKHAAGKEITQRIFLAHMLA